MLEMQSLKEPSLSPEPWREQKRVRRLQHAQPEASLSTTASRMQGRNLAASALESPTAAFHRLEKYMSSLDRRLRSSEGTGTIGCPEAPADRRDDDEFANWQFATDSLPDVSPARPRCYRLRHEQEISDAICPGLPGCGLTH